MKSLSRCLFFILVASFSLVSMSACTGYHSLGKDATLSIKGHSHVITTQGEHHVIKNLNLESDKLTGKSIRTGEELSLKREQVTQIRTTSHAKGMVRGAGYGALTGAGLGILVSVGDPIFMLPLIIGFTSIFAIPAGTVGLLAGYQDIYNLTNKSNTEINNTDATLPGKNLIRQRSPYYGGISYKTFTGSTPNQTGGTSWRNLAPINTTAPVMEFGITINPYLLLGVQFSFYSLDEYNYPENSSDYSWETFSDYQLVATMFPNKYGHFWKLGVGLTDYYGQRENDYVYNPVKGSQAYYFHEHTEQGLTSQISLGYAFELGEHLNLTVSADVNSQYFQWQRNSHFFGISFGGYWY